MHSCELLTHLRTKKVLCHRVEVVKNFQCCKHGLCFLQQDWCRQNYTQTAMKPKGSAGCHQTLSSWVGSGHETTLEQAELLPLFSSSPLTNR